MLKLKPLYPNPLFLIFKNKRNSAYVGGEGFYKARKDSKKNYKKKGKKRNLKVKNEKT
jgi:hypothetical protein